jgi:hypothetical protein
MKSEISKVEPVITQPTNEEIKKHKEQVIKDSFDDACSLQNDFLEFIKELENEKEDEKIIKLEEFYKKSELKYDKFFHTFAVVTKLIIFSNIFSVTTLHKFLKKFFEHNEMPKTYEEYLDRQLEYVYLYNIEVIENYNNKPGNRKISLNTLEKKALEQKEEFKKKLLDDYNKFNEMMTKIKEKSKNDEINEKKEKLKRMIMNIKKQEE